MKLRFKFVFSLLTVVAACAFGQTPPQKWVPLAMEMPKDMPQAMPMGQKAPTDLLHLSVALPYADTEGIKAFADTVSNPNSPNYRKFLTPTEVGRRFGLSAAKVKQVADYLKSQGMKIRLVAKNRLSILAEATVSQAQTAFNTTIENFTLLSAGKSTGSSRFSYTSTPNVPAAISSYVGYIGGFEPSTASPRFTKVEVKV